MSSWRNALVIGMSEIWCSLPGYPLKPSFKWILFSCLPSKAIGEMKMEEEAWGPGNSEEKV